MAVDQIGKLGRISGIDELKPAGSRATVKSGQAFAEALKDAVSEVDKLQHESEAAQTSYARGEQVDLHNVLIKVEEAEVAFRTMMEVRTKLIDAYREIMRIGSGG